MADYDSGEVTERERLAAARQGDLARFNRDSVNNQLDMQLAGYDQANRQNAALRDVQLKQVGRKGEADRFEAARNLRNASIGLLGSMGQAMNGSALGNFGRMLEDRNDADNQTYWNQLQENRNSINNAYDESYNQNQVAANDAITNAAKAIRDIESDYSANLSNINPNLWIAPGTEEAQLGAWYYGGPYDQRRPDHIAQLSGYIMPENSVQEARRITPRDTARTRSNYFNQLINGFNRR